jgi:hypothetical protein
MDDGHCWGDVDRDAVVRYTLGRQTQLGGFSFYAYPAWGVDEPNVPDTYAALAILQILKIAVPNAETCRAWLLHEQYPSGGFPMIAIAYAAFKALQILGSRPLYDLRDYLQRSAQVLGFTDTPEVNLAGKTKTVLQCLKLWHAYDIAIGTNLKAAVRDAVVHLRGPHGGYGDPGVSVVKTAAAMELCQVVGLALDPDALDFVQRCERPPFGMNINPTSVSSSLECLGAGLRLLCLFGVAPRFPEEYRVLRGCLSD